MNNTLPPYIPTEVYLGFLGRTIEIHWSYHAILMFLVWFVLVPSGIITIRYFKPKPKPMGIRKKISLANREWWWFNVHQYVLYLAIVLSLGGVVVALTVSRGFSGSVHSIFGGLTVLFGALQILSAWTRGTHGGKYYYQAKDDQPQTWVGDHYDMTPRRRRFEAYHKTAGYCAGFFAVGAVASGLMQYPMPALGVAMLVVIVVIVSTCIVLEYQGRRYDTYRAVFGNDPEHPHNVGRKSL
jgi:FtsH-binding integral membrane protein